MLDAGPLVISEFMANNNNTLRDNDGAYSDWIEIHNPTDAAVSLNGWYLTDDSTTLTKWQFPSVSIDAGGYLVVYASEKNRVDPAQPLHTNFKLAAEGEYLALVQPDGVTISHDFAPTYPALPDDVSFGLPGAADNVLHHVPTSSDAGANWTTSGYNDSAWKPLSPPSICVTEIGTGSIDYVEIQNLSGTVVDTSGWKLVVKASTSGTAYVQMDLPSVMNPGQLFFRNTVNPRGVSWKLLEYQGTEFPSTVTWASTSPGYAFVMDDQGTVVDFVAWGYTQANLAAFSATVNGFQITADTAWLGAPVPVSSLPILSRSGTSDHNTAADFSWGPVVPAWYGNYMGTIGAQNPNLASAFPPTSAALGFAKYSTGLNTPIATDVSVAMQGVNSSIWTRREFVSDGPAGLTEMTLRIRYNDGFVAYLNGVEIARANAPTTVAWNSAATATRSLADSIQYVDIDVSAYIGLLQDGVNVLAVQGLNNTASDGDFLLEAELIGAGSVDAHRYFFVSTPGAANGMGASETDLLPQFSHATGVYFSSFALTLSTSLPGAVIRYTLDQSDPTEASPIYTGPITISKSERVRAAVFVNGQTTSLVASESFFVLDPALQAFDSNLDLVVLDTHGQSINGTRVGTAPNYKYTTVVDYTTVSAAFFEASGGNRASLSDTPSYTSLAGVKLRGTYSLWLNDNTGMPGDIRLGEKPSYRLELRDELGDDLSASLFGMAEDADWILSSLYDDGALMRDYLSYQWYNEMGHWAPSGRFIELYVNEDGDAVTAEDYVGLYVLLEKIEVGNDRLDIADLNPEDNAAPDVTGGYVIKKDRLKPGDAYITTSSGYQFIFDTPDADALTAAQKAYLTSYMNEFETVLNGTNFADPVNGYAKYIDVDSFIDMHIMQEMAKNYDGFKTSMYFYKDVDGKLKAGPLWDMNIAYGVSSKNWNTPWSHPSPELWHYSLISSTDYKATYFPRLFQDPEFAQKYTDRLNELMNTVFKEDKMMADIGGLEAMLDEAQARHFERWPNLMGEYVWPQAWWGQTYDEYVNIMRNWIHARLMWIKSQYTVAPEISKNGGTIDPGTSVELAAPVGTIYYTTDGTDPRLAGGGISPSAIALTTTAANTQFIASGATWQYLDTGVDQGTAWRELGFDRSAWKTGASELGYGDGGEATVVSYGPNASNKYITTYFAKTFNVADASAFEQLNLLLLRDDAAVVYINGQEVARNNITYANVYYNTLATQDVADGAGETTYAQYLIDPSILVDGTNLIAVEVHQSSASSADLSFNLQLQGVGGVSGDVAINENTRVMARALSGTSWSGLTDAVFEVATSPIRITEIMFNPLEPSAAEVAAGFTDNELFEYIELTNTGASTASLAGLRLTDGTTFDFSAGSVTTLAPGGFVLVVRNTAAFAARYGAVANVAGVFTGALGNGGDTIALVNGIGAVIETVEYSDSTAWPGRAQGSGSSLERVDLTGDSNDPDNWRASAEYGGSPGWAGVGPLDDIVINEVLSHPAGDVAVDAIELHNTTNHPINVGGWYLSDSNGNYQKYRIPSLTVIPAGGYIVFDEHQFNAAGGVAPDDFAFDAAHGDDAWLLQADASGRLLRFVDHVEFGAAASGESFGRWPDADGGLYPMIATTLGSANSAPRIGPVVISEVQYHPEGDANAGWEYVELYNPTGAAVDLSNWRLGGGVTFVFQPGTTIASHATLVVTTFDPTVASMRDGFKAYYGLTGTVAMAGPYSGSLDNSGEDVQLLRPDTPPAEEPTFTPYLLEDAVDYDDASPWPTTADGGGLSLQRRSVRSLGDVADGWNAATPTPGTFAQQTAVVDRLVFYNNSKFDNAAKGWTDDLAVATDKTALLLGQTATFANYTSYSRGINGIMIDVMALPDGAVIDASDFAFRVGNSDDVGTWTTAPAPLSVAVRLGAGEGGSDRIVVTWSDGAIRKQWLEVTVLAAGLGLADNDVFYWGNAIGETGDNAANALVDMSDALAARTNSHGPLNPATVVDVYDFNHDGLVNATDVLIAQQNMTSVLNGLRLITPTAPVEAAAAHDVVLEQAAPAVVVNHRLAREELAWAASFERDLAERRAPRVYGPQPRAIDRVLLMMYGL